MAIFYEKIDSENFVVYRSRLKKVWVGSIFIGAFILLILLGFISKMASGMVLLIFFILVFIWAIIKTIDALPMARQRRASLKQGKKVQTSFVNGFEEVTIEK